MSPETETPLAFSVVIRTSPEKDFDTYSMVSASPTRKQRIGSTDMDASTSGDNVLIRVGSLSRIGRFSSGRGSIPGFGTGGGSAKGETATTLTSWIVTACGCLIGLLLLMSLYDTGSSTARGAKGVAGHWTAKGLPRDRLLQSQLTEVNKELQDLRAELESVRTGVRDREASLLHKEELIRELQSKAAAEHEAKTKAQLALLDRAEALQDCKAKHTALAGEVAQCHSDLSAVLAGEVHKQRKSQYTV